MKFETWFVPSVMAVLGGACTSAAGDGAVRSASSPPSAVAATPPAVEPAKPAPEAPPAAEPAPPQRFARTVYDLLAHVDHAQLREGDVLVMDHGVSAGAQYTLGGWRTRVGDDTDDAGASVVTLRGRHGEVLLPIDFEGTADVRFSARAPGDGRFTVYLDGENVRSVKADAKSLSVHTLKLEGELAGKGEHALGFRGTKEGRVGRIATGMAIDWVRVGPEGAAIAEDAPADVEALSREAGALVVPDGVTVGYTLQVPKAAALRGELSGTGDGSLSVIAVRDDGREELVTQGVRAGVPLDVDLAALEGQVVRLDLRARGDVHVKGARIVELLAEDPARSFAPVKNVLVYLIDTLRADHLKAFNESTRVRTPGMDALAKTASVFTRAHTQENWTKPSVATLLSSLLPWEHHATTTEAVVPRSVKLLPQYLQPFGYFTGAFIANGYVGGNFGFDRGWDTYRNYIREGRRSRSKFVAADVLDWLDKRPKEVPFFLYVHTIDPHVPYRPTGKFMSLYDPDPYDGPVDFAHDFELLEKVKSGRIKLRDRDKQHLEALYDSEISYHDVHFNAILQGLESRGLADDTLVIVTADHGEEFWDHGSVGHGHNIYEELLHIPMLVRLPGVPTPARVSQSVGLVDVAPTVFEAIGEPIPEGLSGRSMLAELLGKGTSAPPVAVSGFMEGWRALSIGPLKLIQRTDKRMMVYDLASDPDEQVDLAESRPILLRYLRGQLGLALSDSEGQQHRGRVRKQSHDKQDTTIDDETEAQLRALGYVGSSRR